MLTVPILLDIPNVIALSIEKFCFVTTSFVSTLTLYVFIILLSITLAYIVHSTLEPGLTEDGHDIVIDAIPSACTFCIINTERIIPIK